MNQVYSGAPESATASISGLGTSSFTFTYNSSATPPTAAGSYTVVATLVNANYQGSISGTLVIAKAGSTTTLALGAEFVGGTVTYNGSSHGATAKWTSTGADGATASLPVSYVGINGTSYASSTNAPTSAGQYMASASFAGDANHAGSSGNVAFTIAPGMVTATVTLGNLSQTYTGMPLSASATTNAPGTSSFTFTYNGSATPPTAAGSYAVVATLVNASYHGSATGTLVIAKATLPVVVNSDLMLANTQNGGCYGNNLQPGWGISCITPATLTNACFADSNDRGPLSDFRVTAASWGDGCIDSTGLNFAGSSGNYSINGGHMYTLPGIYTFCIHVIDRFGQTSVITGSTTVCDQYGNAPGTPALTGTANANPFTNITTFKTAQGDVLTVALSSTVRANSPVGTYPITATVIGAASANYVTPAAANMYVVTIGKDTGTGGRGVSFWDNSGNSRLITSADLASLDSLNLVNASGSSFNPTVASQLQSLLKNDNSTVATFLSAQLATMDLNVLSGNVQSSAQVYAGDLLQFAGTSYSTNGLDTGGFITVGNLMTLANNALAAYQQQGNGFCTNGILEAYMLALADALQAANNNTSFAS